MEFPEWRIGRPVKAKVPLTKAGVQKGQNGTVGYYLVALPRRFWVRWNSSAADSIFEASDWDVLVESNDPPKLEDLRRDLP